MYERNHRRDSQKQHFSSDASVILVDVARWPSMELDHFAFHLVQYENARSLQLK